MKTVKDYIRTIVDFPHEGILFRDVTTLFADPRGFRMAIDQMLHSYAGEPIGKVVGLEARGFILGGAIAHQLSVGFVPIRKKGKLPGTTISQDYKLEYGEAIVEVHDDAIQPGEKVRDTVRYPKEDHAFSFFLWDKKTHVQLPAEFAGNVMVFKAFETVSYALVMDGDKPVKVGAALGLPQD